MTVLPSAGPTLLGVSFATTPGGKGANQAVAASRAGAEVAFVAVHGDDNLGRQAVDLPKPRVGPPGQPHLQ